MSSIHVLDESTINQIAAGEVVERPSAVVKELVENAMDAKATAVTVEIKDGGLSFIRITDNGSGIAKDDIPLAFLRHATSKIYKAEDLLCIKSLGFRGEALSSIAAVAQVELITKTPSSLNGYRYIIEGGVEKSMEEIGCPTGTTIIVRNLFYNTPARRKFLKSAMTEAGYIGDLMEKILISHPEVAFKYIVNNGSKLQSSGNNNPKDILYSIYGRDIFNDLLPVSFSDEKIKVSGYIGKPSINRGNRAFENYFINGRYVKNNVITKSIEEAYKPFLMQHKYPFTSIYLEIDPSLIDVNVHPQKMELRLRNGDEIYRLLFNLVRNTLTGNELIPKVSLDSKDEKETKAAEKAEIKAMPEPFELNRRKQFENDIVKTGNHKSGVNQFASGNQSHSYGSSQQAYQNYQKIADKNADYLTATRPLIQADLPISGLQGLKQAMTNNSADSLNENKSITSEIHNTTSVFNDINNGKKDFDSSKNSIYIDVSGNNSNADGKSIDSKLNSDSISKMANDESKHLFDEFHADSNESQTNSYEGQTCSVESQANPYEGHAGSFDQTADKSEDNNAQKIYRGQQISLFNISDSEDDAPFLSAKAIEEHRIIGQLFSTYWLVEYKKELYIIDQHAAHEKVMYERLMAAAKSKTYKSQQLLPPIVLTLTLKEQEVLAKHGDVLRSLGYEFEHFGGNEYSIRAVPADIYSISEKALLLEFIDELADEGAGSLSSSTSILEKVASLSCKAAVKANHTLSYEEAKVLIKELLTLENPYNCPHGRPVIISMSKYELERKFKRVL